MPDRIVLLNKVDAVTLYNRLSTVNHHTSSRAHLAHVVKFMKRLMDAWPEAGPDAEEGAYNAIAADVKREIKFTTEEQRAVAEGFTRLASGLKITVLDGAMRPVERATTAADIVAIIDEAKKLGSGIVRYIETHLAPEKVEPFDGEWDEDTKTLEAEEAPAKD